MNEQRGPYTVAQAQYTLVKNWRGTWDLTTITGKVLATFMCKRLHLEQSTGHAVYLWTCEGHRLANDPQGAVNTWLAQHAGEVAA